MRFIPKFRLMFCAAFAGWGVANSDKFKVIARLRVSDQITDESRALGRAPFTELKGGGQGLY